MATARTDQEREQAVLHALYTGSTRAAADKFGVTTETIRSWVRQYPWDPELRERAMAMRAKSSEEAWAATMASLRVLRSGVAKYIQAHADDAAPDMAELSLVSAVAERVARILKYLGETEEQFRLHGGAGQGADDLGDLSDEELMALTVKLDRERDDRGGETVDLGE